MVNLTSKWGNVKQFQWIYPGTSNSGPELPERIRLHNGSANWVCVWVHLHNRTDLKSILDEAKLTLIQLCHFIPSSNPDLFWIHLEWLICPIPMVCELHWWWLSLCIRTCALHGQTQWTNSMSWLSSDQVFWNRNLRVANLWVNQLRVCVCVVNVSWNRPLLKVVVTVIWCCFCLFVVVFSSEIFSPQLQLPKNNWLVLFNYKLCVNHLGAKTILVLVRLNQRCAHQSRCHWIKQKNI